MCAMNAEKVRKQEIVAKNNKYVFSSILGFYRKDHLRKHTRSHIARRVKSEMTAQNASNGGQIPQSGQALHLNSWENQYKDFW